MIRRLLIASVVVLALGMTSMFLPARQLSIESIGWLSFETKITLSIGSETAYAAPDITTHSPTADSASWTNSTNAYADGGGYASVISGTPSVANTYSGYGFNLVGNTINQVRVRYDAWCAGNASSANQQRVPTADGVVNGTWTTTPPYPSSRWDKVDETTPNDVDYITGTSTSGGSAYSLFTFSAFTVPAGSTITDLTVYFRARDWGGGNPANNMMSSLRIGGTNYNTATSVDPGSSFVTYSYAYTTNPRTGAAWTVADINGAGTNPLQQFGVYSTDLNPDIRVSMVYAQVNYTTTVYDEQIRVDVSWDGGTSWSLQQTTTLTGAEATYWYDVTGAPGIPWTPTMLDDAHFIVRVDAYSQGVASEVRLDWIPVEVNYMPPTGWLCGWDNRVKLTIDHNDITGTDPLTDFPVLVYLSTSSGRGADNLSFVFNELQSDANRFKIAITTVNGTSECYVEIEKWSQANQQAWLWVKVPSISNTVDTDLYLYYDRDHADNNQHVGDTNATYIIEGNPYTPAEQVWDGSYKLVQHLGENATVVHDSTVNNNDETNPPPEVPPPNITPPYVRATYTDSGRLDGGYAFSNDGTNGTRLQMNHSDSLNITDNITLEAFVYLNNKTDGKFIAKDDPFPGGAGCYNLQQETSSLQFALDLGGWYRASYAAYNTGQWYYVAGTYDRQTMTLYLNGTQVATNGQTAAITSGPVNLALGNRADDAGLDFDLNGMLDEIRISNTPRNSAWIYASYESERDHLIDYGTPELYPADIVNTPESKDFETVDEDSDYWAQTGTTGPWADNYLDNSECFFTLSNNSPCAIKISIRATNFTGGVGWTLTSGSPVGLPDQVRMKVGSAGISSENEMVILTTGDQGFIPSLGAYNSSGWELKLETGTFTDVEVKTSTITLTATSA